VTRNHLARILHSHNTVWKEWWPALIALAPEQARRVVGGSYPSVFMTTQHLVDAEAYWLQHLDGAPQETGATRATTMAALQETWAAVRSRTEAWAAAADPDAPVRFRASSGDMAQVTAWECLIHVVSHAHFHRGQLVHQLRALGLTPPERHLLGPFFGEF
jgi:uncharacterized damage-inducible protein DinB